MMSSAKFLTMWLYPDRQRTVIVRFSVFLLLVAGMVVSCLPAASEEPWLAGLRVRAAAAYPEAVELRRRLHRIPEPCFQERETAALLIDYLQRLGLEVHGGVAGTGIKAILRGGKPGPAVGIRADMDALPVTETTGLPFTSQKPGTMHACGHDVHMTNALIAARLLAEMRADLPGTVVFLFQPCEEGTPGTGQAGGADRMVEAGVLDDPPLQALIGLHVLPDLPIGTVGVRPGPIMAASAALEIRISGRAAHGAFPHQGIDAIYAAAQAIVQFQSLLTRRKDPAEPAVLSIGTIRGGTRRNVVADEVVLEGTVRTFSEPVERDIETGMENILKGLAIVYGIQYRFNFERSIRFVQNDPQLVDKLTPLFRDILGKDNVRTVAPLTIAEDFSVYSHRLPCLFFFLGSGGTRLHAPDFAVAEEALKTAPLLFAAAARWLLEMPRP